MRRKIVDMGTGNKEKGQVAILFALVFTFMFILFAFVVDFGHLVNTKINLQLAADSAAYAGAAWQARTLNKIAAVNYRIRQDVKELAMRVQVTHLRHNRNFPRGTQFMNGQPQVPQTEPFICQQAHGYQSISGVQYAEDTNLCRNASPSTGGLPPIVVPPVIAAFDPFAVAIAAQIRRIQEASNQECRAAAEDNRVLSEHLVNVYTRRSQFHLQQTQALADFLNQVSGENPMTSTHALIQTARESAERNLSQAARNNFKMEIMNPSGNRYIELADERMNASMFFVNFNVEGDGCVGRANFVDFNEMIANVRKVQSVVTYFAVKLTARPQMLFMPAPWVDAAFPRLEAFAAAKPFGSRIGPDMQLDPLVPVANRLGNQNRMINFSFFPGDTLGIMNTKIMALLDALHPFNDVGRPQGRREQGWPLPQQNHPAFQALAAIRAPSRFDALMYTVFPDPGGNTNTDYLEPQYAQALYPDYLEPGDPDLVRQPATNFYYNLNSQNRGQGWVQVNATNSGTGGPYAGYGEEEPESHAITSFQALNIGVGNPSDFGWASPDDIHSGWAPQGRPGRIGYSVKFVPFFGIAGGIEVVDQGTRAPLVNPVTGDPNVTRIQH